METVGVDLASKGDFKPGAGTTLDRLEPGNLDPVAVEPGPDVVHERPKQGSGRPL